MIKAACLNSRCRAPFCSAVSPPRLGQTLITLQCPELPPTHNNMVLSARRARRISIRSNAQSLAALTTKGPVLPLRGLGHLDP